MGSVQIRELVEIENDEADLGEATGSGIDFTGLEIRLIVTVGGQDLVKVIRLAGFLGHDGSLNADGVGLRFVSLALLLNGRFAPMLKAGTHLIL